MILEMSSPQVTFLAELAGIFSKTFLSISFIVEKFHVTLVEDSPSELDIANPTDMSLLHVRFNMTCSS